MLPAINAAVVDRHPAIREGIARYLSEAMEDLQIVGSFASSAELTAAAAPLDVVLVDLNLTDERELRVVQRLRGRGTRTLIYTDEDRLVPLRHAIEAGAAGIVRKCDPLEVLPPAIRGVLAGKQVYPPGLGGALRDAGLVVPKLSMRQVQVLRAIDEGLDRRSAARALGVSEGVVKTHLARIREKYQKQGIEPGNSHHLTHLASAHGYLR